MQVFTVITEVTNLASLGWDKKFHILSTTRLENEAQERNRVHIVVSKSWQHTHKHC